MTSVKTMVSVVLPIHNAGRYLDRTRQQLSAMDTSVDYEFVLIDDHSTDDSRDQITSWASELPGAHRVLDATGRGVAAARNEALASCTGTYVWMADADDEWDSRIVTSMVTTAKESAADVVVCNAVKQTPDGTHVGTITDAVDSETYDGREALIRVFDGRLQGHLWNKLFTRQVLGEQPFPETRAHSDLGGLLRVLPRVERIAGLPLELYVYFQNPNSILNSAAYDFGDLRRCLQFATAASAMFTLGRSERVAFVRFSYRNVHLPSLNEIARRTSGLDRFTRREESRMVQRGMRWGDLVLLARAGDRLLALQAAIAKLSPSGYRRLYRLLKTRRQHARVIT